MKLVYTSAVAPGKKKIPEGTSVPSATRWRFGPNGSALRTTEVLCHSADVHSFAVFYDKVRYYHPTCTVNLGTVGSLSQSLETSEPLPTEEDRPALLAGVKHELSTITAEIRRLRDALGAARDAARVDLPCPPDCPVVIEARLLPHSLRAAIRHRKLEMARRRRLRRLPADRYALEPGLEENRDWFDAKLGKAYLSTCPPGESCTDFGAGCTCFGIP